MASDGSNLNAHPLTRKGQGVSGLPLSNRGVRPSGSEKTWAGIDWLAGSVDLFDTLRAAGLPLSWRDLEKLSENLSAVGPKPKPKDGEGEADENGVLTLGKSVPFVPPDEEMRGVAVAAFEYLFGGTGLVLSSEAGAGKFYAFRYMLRNVFGEPAGMIEFGGCLTLRKGGRPSLRFELTGLGCSILEHRNDASADHAQLWCAMKAKLSCVGTMLTRIDCAFDDFLGERDVARAKTMWQVGEFDYSFGGEMKRPKAKGFEDYGSNDGCTFYVGMSSSEKQLRVYEKGKQLGDPDSPWVRWELQLRSSTRKRITLDVLDDPMAYMRGAFACLDFVSSCMSRLEVTNEATKACVKSVLRHAKRMYGATFHQLRLLAPDQESFVQLVEKLQTEKVPRWAKTGRPTWADVAGLNQPTDDEGNEK